MPGVTADALLAVFRGEETLEAELGSYILADFVNRVRRAL